MGAVFLTLALATVGESRGANIGASLGAVRAATTGGQRLLTLSTTSLYAKNDPWMSYLASESTCPGGERTDLPVARQVATVACLVNFARTRRGLRVLPVALILSQASEQKAQAMIKCEGFEHNPCRGDWTHAVRSAGYSGAFGENLYLATGRWGAPRVAVDAWLNSSSHRKNLFRREWRRQGLALVPGATFGPYRNVSLWVSVLGDR